MKVALKGTKWTWALDNEVPPLSLLALHLRLTISRTRRRRMINFKELCN